MRLSLSSSPITMPMMGKRKGSDDLHEEIGGRSTGQESRVATRRQRVRVLYFPVFVDRCMSV